MRLLHRPSILVILAVLFILLCGRAVPGDEDSAKLEREAQTKRRLEFMQAALAECKPASDEITAKGALQVGKSPLLRYDDPTRGMNAETLGLLDGGEWRMGERGRPTALVTLEVYRAAKGGVLGYEFVKLTPARFEVTMPRGPMIP